MPVSKITVVPGLLLATNLASVPYFALCEFQFLLLVKQLLILYYWKVQSWPLELVSTERVDLAFISVIFTVSFLFKKYGALYRVQINP